MATSRRLRLNVSALANNEVQAKVLVVADENSTLAELDPKIHQALKRSGITAPVRCVLNSLRAQLPDDELLGHMLVDGEECYAVLDGVLSTPPLSKSGSGDTTLLVVHSPPRGPDAYRAIEEPAASVMQFRQSYAPVPPPTVHEHGGMPIKAVVTLPPQVLGEPEESEEESDTESMAPAPQPLPPPPPPPELPAGPPKQDYPPLPVQHGGEMLPGPSEQFVAEKMPYDAVRVDHPCDPVPLKSYDTDWLVESLTPRLREFVLQNVQGDLITEPKFVPALGKFVGSRFLQDSGSFVSIFMRPQTTLGSDPSATMPVHYNIARADIQRFHRMCQSYIEAGQEHMDLFSATLRSLQSLVARGHSEDEHVNLMLPHTYQAFDEVEGVMMEVEQPMIPLNTAGSNPVLIVDTSGMTGRHITYLKAALKRVLYAQMASKSSFQLIRFTQGTGEPRLWAKEMAPPTEAAFQAAEDWIEGLTPMASCGKLLSAIHYAMAHQACDEIYIVSSAEIDRRHHDQVLLGIRQLNTREVAIHTVGVAPEPAAELLLRNISESNHGDFNMKLFDQPQNKAFSSHDARWTSWRTNLVNEKSKEMSESFKKQRMSIGAQIRIVQVMQREEAQKEVGWREEWRCAQRLLVCQDEERHVQPDRDTVKELQRRTSRTQSARVGGGFAYATEEPNLGLEGLFEHKSAVPWTANTETRAIGPKVPIPDAGAGRAPRFPPSVEMLPLPPPDLTQPYPQSERRPRTRSTPRAMAPGGGSARKSSDGAWRPLGPASRPLQMEVHNPWAARPPAAAGGLDRTRRPPSARSSAGRTASADRAAGGGRSKSPAKKRSKTPPPTRERRAGEKAAPPPAAATLPPPNLERRWSF